MSKHKVTRYNGEEGSEVSAEDEAAMDAYGRFVESGPKAMPAAPPKAKVVTKEELTKSGLSLRDYMNKQQGLTRRVDAPAKVAPPAASGPGRAPTPPKAKYKYETPYDRMNRTNREDEAAKASTADETARLRQRNMPASKFDASKVDSKTLLPKRMAKGGSTSSASSRADGIAQRGKTRGTMMCSGGMAKGKK